MLVIACKAILYRVGGALSRAGHSSRSVLALFENSAAMLWPGRPTLTSAPIIFAQNVHLVANTPGYRTKASRFPFRRPISYRESDPVIHAKPATAGFLANPERCVRCDRPAGAAGTPRAPRPLPLLAGVSVPARIFPPPDWDTNRIRIACDSLRTRYEQNTNKIRIRYEYDTNKIIRYDCRH